MDIGTLRGLLTAALLILFLCIVFWAYSRRRRADFERAAQLPLEEHERPPAGGAEEESAASSEQSSNRSAG